MRPVKELTFCDVKVKIAVNDCMGALTIASSLYTASHYRLMCSD